MVYETFQSLIMWVVCRAKPQAHWGIPKCTRQFLGVPLTGAPIALNVKEKGESWDLFKLCRVMQEDEGITRIRTQVRQQPSGDPYMLMSLFEGITQCKDHKEKPHLNENIWQEKEHCKKQKP